MKFEVFWKNPGYKARPKLKRKIECDYLIVGGGITGVSVAYFLAKQGVKNIVLIEKHTVGCSATGEAAGTLVVRGETDLSQYVKYYGFKKAALLWSEIQSALRGLRKIITEENIDCDAEPQDTLYCDYPKKKKGYLREEFLFEKQLDKNAVWLEKEALTGELNTPLFAHGILSKNHGLSVNPLKFVQILSKKIEKYGVKIYENTALLKAQAGVAKTRQGNIRYKNLILAIDSEHPSAKVKRIKSTIVVTRQLTSEEINLTGFKKKKIVFDDGNHYYYFKLTKDQRLLLGFGDITVHKKHRQRDPHFPHLKNILEFIKKLFPYLDLPVEYAWSGGFGKSFSDLPLVEFKNNEIAIAGCATQVVCFMTAKYVADKLLNKKSPLQPFFELSS